MAHANARLTRREGWSWSVGSPPSHDGRSPTSPTRWASPGPPPTAGGPATSSWARRAWSIARASPCEVHGGLPPASSSASSDCAGASGSARPGSPPGSGGRPPPCIGCWSVMAATGWCGWTARPAGRSAAMSTHGPATWSTWRSRSWAASPPGAATESTAGLPGRPTAAPTVGIGHRRAVSVTLMCPRCGPRRGRGRRPSRPG